MKDVFGILLQHMRDTASSRNIKTVDLVPLVFSKVVPKKNLFSISQGKKSQMVQAWNIMFLHIHLGHSAPSMAHHYPT